MSVRFSEAELDQIAGGGVVVRDHAADVAGWLAVARQTPLAPAGVGRLGALHPELRSDRTAFVDGADPAWAEVVDWYAALGVSLGRGLRVALPAFSLQVAVYGPGDKYVAHTDALAGDPIRRVTAIVYLDPTWTEGDGGSLRAAGRTILPVGGRLVVFRADRVEHEVEPPTRDRWALTAWYGTNGAIRR